MIRSPATDGRPVAVVGADGLIGAELCAQLAATGRTAFAIVRPGQPTPPRREGVTRVEVDLEGGFDLRPVLSRTEVVIYLAQASSHNAFPAAAGAMAALNVAAPCRLAEQSVECGVRRFIFASSGGVCGTPTEEIPDGAPAADAGSLSFYLKTKVQAEQLLAMFAPHLVLTVLRYFFVYGPKQRKEMLMARMIDCIRNDRPIRLAGGQGPQINPIFVRDAARATILLSGHQEAGIHNVAGAETVSLRGICDHLGRLLDREPVYEELAEDPARIVASIDRLKSAGFEHSFDLDAGLRETVGPLTAIGS